MKYTDCDASDMQSWANTPMAKSLEAEVLSLRDVALRRLIKKPTEADAAEVRSFEKILTLFKECRREK